MCDSVEFVCQLADSFEENSEVGANVGIPIKSAAQPRYRVEARSGVVDVYDTQHPEYSEDGECKGCIIAIGSADMETQLECLIAEFEHFYRETYNVMTEAADELRCLCEEVKRLKVARL